MHPGLGRHDTNMKLWTKGALYDKGVFEKLEHCNVLL